MFNRPNAADPEFKIAKARSDLITTQPFFGTLALRLRLKETDDPRCSVMGTDGKYLYYNRKAIRAMPQQQVMGVVAHEVMHCALQHMFRRRARNPEKWNRACDYVINSVLLKERFSLPEGRLFNAKYSDMSSEEVYEKLPNKPPPNGGGSGTGGWDFGSSFDPSVPDADGNQASQSEIEQRSVDWNLATQQAALVAKNAGKLPGDLDRMVADTLKPQVPWREQLWGYLNKTRPGRISWNRPNRRLLNIATMDGRLIPMSLPSRTVEPTGEIVIAVDTSGSVSEEELMHFSAEISEIHRTIQPEKTTILYIDSTIADPVEEFGPLDDCQLSHRGGGGTAFEPAFQWLRESNSEPDAFLYLTDGYAHFPEEYTECPCIWVITNHDVVPPWGEHIILDI